RVAQPEPLLQEVDAQHHVDAHRRAAGSALRVVRLDQCDELWPRHDALHLFEELALASALAREVQAEIRLLHHFVCFKSTIESSHRRGLEWSGYADVP